VSQLSGSSVPPVMPGAPLVTLPQLTASLQFASNAAGSWGSNTPQWRLFAHGWTSDLSSTAAIAADNYLVAWVADDIGETDGDPSTDSNGRIQVMARAISRRGIQRNVALTVAQTIEVTNAGAHGVRVLSWREVR